MNYITEIRAFNDLLMVKSLSTGQIALWYALMHINNRCSWMEWFSVSNLTLQLHTGLSRGGIEKSRNALKQLNLIDFKSNGSKATTYTLKRFDMSNSVQHSTQDSTQKRSRKEAEKKQESIQNSRTLIKQKHKLKLKDKEKEKQAKEKGDSFSEMVKTYTENEDLRKTLADFIFMRKAIKKPMTERALSMLLKKLDAMALNDPARKIQILENSIYHNWQDIFPLKEEKEGSNGKVQAPGKYEHLYTVGRPKGT